MGENLGAKEWVGDCENGRERAIITHKFWEENELLRYIKKKMKIIVNAWFAREDRCGKDLKVENWMNENEREREWKRERVCMCEWKFRELSKRVNAQFCK